ncbi:hypothetical protein P171DRAFT_503796 [Karstenula rhodostoma CBS 690.94]|uniref:Pal1-domain-containing protein n=1 Tax=Karstenula rhodostoma CBS 690.94 TaxID=1392251 RepID=A0A9P4PTC7_9PLEO|nr:hypothetical protein P171DRAFT_503796 [Karstenula rhodostoma CBS 690.94]
MFLFMIPQQPEGMAPLPMTFRKAPIPEETPEIIAPKPEKEYLFYEIAMPGSSTHSLLNPDDDDNPDTASNMYAASVASSLDLTEVEPRTFMDIVDDAIPVRTKYRRPKPPPRNGSPDSFHDLRFGAEVLPNRHHRRHRSHSQVPVSFTADREPCRTKPAADPTQVTWSYDNDDYGRYRRDRLMSDVLEAQALRRENQRRRSHSTSALSSANTWEVSPAQIGMDKSGFSEIGVLSPEEMWPDLVGTSDTQSGGKPEDTVTDRPKKGIVSRFKKFIQPHGKNDKVPGGEKDDKKNPRTGMNMLSATMGYGMGRF